MVDKLTIFINRMGKLWIDIDTINGKRVIEKFQSNHGFTIVFAPIKDNQELKFTDIGEIFKLIRKYR